MKTLTVTRDARGVAHVTMARPDVFNAFDETMVAELDTTFTELGADGGTDEAREGRMAFVDKRPADRAKAVQP